MMIIYPASLPVQPVIDRVHDRTVSGRVTFGNSRLELLEGSLVIIQQAPAADNAAGKVQEQEKPLEQKAEKPKSGKQDPPPAQDKSGESPQQAVQQQDKRSFWQRLFKLPPLRDRIEKSLNEEWKFPSVRPRHIEYLMSEDGEEAR